MSKKAEKPNYEISYWGVQSRMTISSKSAFKARSWFYVIISNDTRKKINQGNER